MTPASASDPPAGHARDRLERIERAAHPAAASDPLPGRDSPAPSRLHDMDALRSFAMLLGIFLHASLALIPSLFWAVQEPWGWQRPLEANLYVYVLSLIHGFRMQVFFLISGFFTAMLLRSRGMRGLARHRLRRVALPLAVGMVTIIPLNLRLFAGDEFPLAYWPLAWLEGFSHLWFLWYLVLMAAALIGAARLGLQFRHSLWWLLLPLSFWLQFLMVEPSLGADTPTGVLPAPHLFGYYFVFFLFGVFFFNRGFQVRAWWGAALAPALATAGPASLVLVGAEGAAVAEGGAGSALKAASAAAQASYGWLMCFGLMGLFRAVASKERFWVRYLSDASYWLYLWHLSLLIIVQRVMLPWSMSVHLKFLLACAAVTGFLLVVYQLGVRYTPVGAVLNGPRTRRGDASAIRRRT